MVTILQTTFSNTLSWLKAAELQTHSLTHICVTRPQQANMLQSTVRSYFLKILWCPENWKPVLNFSHFWNLTGLPIKMQTHTNSYDMEEAVIYRCIPFYIHNTYPTVWHVGVFRQFQDYAIHEEVRVMKWKLLYGTAFLHTMSHKYQCGSYVILGYIFMTTYPFMNFNGTVKKFYWRLYTVNGLYVQFIDCWVWKVLAWWGKLFLWFLTLYHWQNHQMINKIYLKHAVPPSMIWHIALQ